MGKAEASKARQGKARETGMESIGNFRGEVEESQAMQRKVEARQRRSKEDGGRCVVVQWRRGRQGGGKLEVMRKAVEFLVLDAVMFLSLVFAVPGCTICLV